jgi:NAD(P)-dependent dehydrogenase (short-subunit alcohol dehydrogenase family)
MTADPFDVRGRTIVVTGGLGRLGLQYGRSLLERGARVASFDLQATPEPYEKRFGEPPDPARLMLLEVDVTRRASLEAGLARVESAFGTPTGLVNNAGLDSPPDAPLDQNGPFEGYPESCWDRVMDVNAKGVFLACQVVGGAMAAAGRGSIVNVCSIYGVVSPDQRLYDGGFVKPVAYSASKSALLNLTRYLATYWAERDVRVNSITLGGVFSGQDRRFVERYESRVPLRRMAREDEYDGAMIFLLSDASSYMTGANLVIDGGWTAW